MLVRTSKKTHPYVILDKSFLHDPDLSLHAKGLLAFCMSMPTDWKFNVHHLTKVLKEGRDSIYRGLQELMDKRYCLRSQERKKGGKFDKCDYILFEEPQEIQIILPLPGSPDTVVQDAAPLYTKEESTKEEERERDKPAPRTPSFSKKIQRAEHVFTNEREHIELCHVYGRENIEACYSILNEWKLDTPKAKWKKSDYSAIIRWVVKALNERNSNSKGNTEADRKLAEKIWNKWKGRNDIRLGSNYLEFIQGVNAPSIELRFGAKGFREECLNQLRKRKLQPEDL